MGRHFGDPFDWVETVPALVIVPLVLLDVLPSWTLVIAFVLSLHIVIRLLIRLAAAADG